jgi:hypothetical protein
MKNQWSWLLLLAVLFFAGDRTGSWFLSQQAAKSQFRYSRLYNGSAAADVLLIGNSRGLAFFQPYIEEKTGKTTFNLSYNGLSMPLAKVLALDYADRYPKVQKAVIDITLCDRSNDELTTNFLTYAQYSPRLSALIGATSRNMWWGAQVSHLARYNSEVFQRALYYRNQSDKDWLLDRVITPQLAADVHNNKYTIGIKDTLLVEALTDLVSVLRDKKIDVQLVIGPYFPGFAGQVEHLDALKNKVEQLTGLLVHDYRAALTENADFGDYMHPNKAGSLKYIDLLQKDGVF